MTPEQVAPIVLNASYYEGARDALHRYAWHKDGTQYVGCGMNTLKQALEQVDEAEQTGQHYNVYQRPIA